MPRAGIQAAAWAGSASLPFMPVLADRIWWCCFASEAWWPSPPRPIAGFVVVLQRLRRQWQVPLAAGSGLSPRC